MATCVRAMMALVVAWLLIGPAEAKPLESPISPIAMPNVIVRPLSSPKPSLVTYGYLWVKR